MRCLHHTKELAACCGPLMQAFSGAAYFPYLQQLCSSTAGHVSPNTMPAWCVLTWQTLHQTCLQTLRRMSCQASCRLVPAHRDRQVQLCTGSNCDW